MRTSNYPIEKLILNRWSPRAMSGESLDEKELMTLFEAARWAPSAYNAQPWRFLYAKRGTPAWTAFFDLLVDFNKMWCANAAVLVVVVSRTTFEHNDTPCPTHSFDSGAAWENLALQASAMGLVAHGMMGFDYNAARTALNVPKEFEINAMLALGKPGRTEDLPKDLQEREMVSDRKPLAEIAMEGGFKSA